MTSSDLQQSRLAQLDASSLRKIRRSSICVSPDRARAAYILDPGTAVVDGLAGPAFESVQGLCFSPDGSRAAYVATAGSSRRVVVQGMAGTTTIDPEVDDVLSPVTFSADGGNYSYTARVGGHYRVMVDQECMHEQPFAVGYDAMIDAPGPRYERPVVWSDETRAEVEAMNQRIAAFQSGQRVMGPGGLHWIHAKERPVASSGAWTIVVDGLLSQRYAEVEGPVFSADGDSVAYWAKEKQADQESIVLNGRTGPVFSSIARLMPFGLRACFAPRSHRLLYQAMRRMRWHVVVDGEPGPEFDWVGDLDLAADGSRVGFPAIVENEIRWIVLSW
ncbi:MAG: hypothetical protein H0V44_13650 [Planctomycetes bacterium]|nr:hypothetical protein [Planctomycetota bacterium]